MGTGAMYWLTIERYLQDTCDFLTLENIVEWYDWVKALSTYRPYSFVAHDSPQRRYTRHDVAYVFLFQRRPKVMGNMGININDSLKRL